jgi:hypothetical protein
MSVRPGSKRGNEWVHPDPADEYNWPRYGPEDVQMHGPDYASAAGAALRAPPPLPRLLGGHPLEYYVEHKHTPPNEPNKEKYYQRRAGYAINFEGGHMYRDMQQYIMEARRELGKDALDTSKLKQMARQFTVDEVNRRLNELKAHADDPSNNANQAFAAQRYAYEMAERARFMAEYDKAIANAMVETAKAKLDQELLLFANGRQNQEVLRMVGADLAKYKEEASKMEKAYEAAVDNLEVLERQRRV